MRRTVVSRLPLVGRIGRLGHASASSADAAVLATGPRGRESGQVLVLFALLLTFLLGTAAFVVDLAWIWTNELKVQRAADAAALAGVIHLPGDVALAQSSAFAESTKNGYQNGVDGVVVVPNQDPDDDRRMMVSVSAPIETFFMQIFGWDTLTITRASKAEYTLPVPMGSPENYYGVFGKVRTPGGGITTWSPGNTGSRVATATKGTNTWTTEPAGGSLVTSVNSSNDQWVASATANQSQAWGNFGFSIPGGAQITGIEVRIEGYATDATGCSITASLSYNNGTSYTSGAGTGLKTLNLTGTEPTNPPHYVLGGSADKWNRGTWTASELSDTNFRLRLTNVRGANCTTGTPAGQTRLDHVQVLVHYQTSTFTPDANLPDPYGAALTPRGLWGTFINQGAEKVNGDAYLPKWDPRTSNQNAEYDPNQYYNYAIEMPVGATSGEVWIFDPAFCATDTNGQFGTGDRWFSGSTAATSAYYTLYDTNNTLYDMTDDFVVSRAHSIFINQQADDDTLFGSGSGPVGTSCASGATSNLADGRFWHNRWYPMQPYVNGGLAEETPASATVGTALSLQGGHIYRLHTRSTSPTSPSAMDNANGHNSFAIWTRASCGGACAASPRVYGLGAMEAFTPLPGGGAAEFYLAEIEPVHAGKWVEIRLWDPGDTGALSATLEIRIPNGGSYANPPDGLQWSSKLVASGGTAACNNRTHASTAANPDFSIVTNTGGSSQFNGCWLTILVKIPDNYDGDAPTATDQNWWKIRYTMGGSTSDNAFDLTTWQVAIRGNPVHLIVP